MRLLFTEAAVADLERLRDFIRRHHPAAANRARDRLVGTAERLTAFPSEGRSVRGREDIREIPLADLPHVSWALGEGQEAKRSS